MQRLLTYTILGGFVYWWMTRPSPVAAATIPVVEKKYPAPIGPGLQGATNVAKVRIMEVRDQPMGTFARGDW